MAKVTIQQASQAVENALVNLVARFHLEGFAKDSKFCRCLQFEDNDECRHTIAHEALKMADTARKQNSARINKGKR